MFYKFPAFMPCESVGSDVQFESVPVDVKSMLVPCEDGRERLMPVSSPCKNPNEGLKYTDFNVDVLQASGMADKLPSLGLLQRDPLSVADSIMHLPAGTFDVIDSDVEAAVAAASAAQKDTSKSPAVTEENAV